MKRRKRVKATKRKPLRKVDKRRKRKSSPVRRKVPRRKRIGNVRKKPRRPRKKVKARKPVRKTRRKPTRAKRRKARKPVRKTRRKPTRAKRRKENLKRRVRRDKVRVFGERRRRQPKEMPKAIVEPDLGQVKFETQLRNEQEKPEGAFAWTNEDEFIQQMELLGFSEREAYTLWFS